MRGVLRGGPSTMVRGGARWIAFGLALFLSPGCGGEGAKKDGHAGADGSAAKSGGTAPYHVGLVFDVGGLGDKSFNDAAYRGLQKAKTELGIEFEYLEPGEGSERDAALRQLASGKAQLVFGVGFLFTDDIKKVAAEYPDKKFACIDYTWQEGEPVPANLAGIKFREEEGSALVGALSALLSKSGTVGFVGGMDIPLIHKFEAGYRAGFLAEKADGKVLVNYAGVTGEAFANPAKGKELALAQIDRGADIIFHASGSTGLGVFEAARERKVLAIGVDSDQQAEAPGFILTSMVKQVDVAVFESVKSAKAGSFQGGVRVLGLKEGGVDYINDANNAQWITPEVKAKVEALRAEIIAGSFPVPSK